MSSLVALAVAAAFAVAWALTGALRRYALARDVLDHPNERSSHDEATPRGGGMAIVVVTVVCEAVLGLTGWLSPREALALAGGGLMVAAVGWWDDHRGVHASVRAAVHFAAAAWALYWLGGMPELRLGASALHLGPSGLVVGALGIVWTTNLYNFMDGIDGLAGAEAVTSALFGGVLLLAVGERGLAAAALVLMAASAGFLRWNWRPAKIFMGDGGSYFVGFTFAVLAVASERAGAVPLLAWVIVLGVFVFDATATLVRRVRRGERWHHAHRSHAYQRAAPARCDHARVTTAVVAVNAVLGALAAAATLRPGWLLPSLAAALLLLAGLYLAVERRRPMYARREPGAPSSTLAPRAR